MASHSMKTVLIIASLFELVGCRGGSSQSGSDLTEVGEDVPTIGASGGSLNTSGNTGGSTNDNSGANTNSQTNTDSTTSNAESKTTLEGEWIRSCIQIDPTDIEQGYRIWSLTFAGNRFSSHIRNFTNPGCISASAIYSQAIFQGHFEFGNTITSSEGLAAIQIDVHTQTPVNNIEYDIFYMTGNELYFGDTGTVQDGTSPENRPNSLDFYWSLNKVQSE